MYMYSNTRVLEQVSKISSHTSVRIKTEFVWFGWFAIRTEYREYREYLADITRDPREGSVVAMEGVT